jgi:hypothetical protein
MLADGNSVLNVLRNSRLIFQSNHSTSIPSGSLQGLLQSLHVFTNARCHLSFYNSHLSGCEGIAHWGFDLHFPDH